MKLKIFLSEVATYWNKSSIFHYFSIAHCHAALDNLIYYIMYKKSKFF